MLDLVETAAIVGGILRGPNSAYGMVEIDSRRLQPRGLFVAIRGKKRNGHRFLEDAYQIGASGAIVSEAIQPKMGIVEVDDTTLALKRLARSWRRRFQIPMINVTGSVGKTTIKNMIATVLGQHGATLYTYGNTNNQYGVPLNLLRLRDHHAYAVLELGMSQFDEIRELAHLCTPDIGLISNARASHLEKMGTVKNVAAAKGQLIEGVRKGGSVILNADDPYCDYWKSLSRFHFVTTYGFGSSADVRGQITGKGASIDICHQNRKVRIPLKVDEAISANLLAVVAVCLQLGLSLAQIAQGLMLVKPTGGRLNRLNGRNGTLVIDDSYNANPASVRAAIHTLNKESCSKRIFVLGDMGELGAENELRYHQEVIEEIDSCSDMGLITLGKLSAEASKNATSLIRSCFTHQEVIQSLQPFLKASCCVLVKGSRAMKMEVVVQALCT